MFVGIYLVCGQHSYGVLSYIGCCLVRWITSSSRKLDRQRAINIQSNEELVRVSEQVKEVVGMRDRYIGSVMSRSECDDILTFLCTGQRWDHEILYFLFCACTNANKEFQT